MGSFTLQNCPEYLYQIKIFLYLLIVLSAQQDVIQQEIHFFFLQDEIYDVF